MQITSSNNFVFFIESHRNNRLGTLSLPAEIEPSVSETSKFFVQCLTKNLKAYLTFKVVLNNLHFSDICVQIEKQKKFKRFVSGK